ncbi:hypothetical protein AgCh_033370 [Apium graveolens]
MPQELPGFYYDAEKNRYFPVKGPIPGSSRINNSPSSSNTASKSSIEPKQAKVRKEVKRTTIKMLLSRELYGRVIISAKGKYNFREEYTKRLVSEPKEQVDVITSMPDGEVKTDLLLAGGKNGSLSGESSIVESKMTYNTRSVKQAESSQQGSLKMMQQEFQGFMEGSDDKFGKLQDQIGKLLTVMNGLMKTQEEVDGEYTDDSDSEMIDDSHVNHEHRRVFRDPIHAAKMRQKQIVTGHERRNEEVRNAKIGGSTGTSDVNSLKHLKLTFPSLKEGSDAVEWLRDCEEYFPIFEVDNTRRAAIAAMHMTGTPRSWYKSFMVGRDRVTWHQFTQAFLARFGEVETELVFDRFKKLQQVTTVEVYFDEFEKCRCQLLSKIPSLTSEYFMENFIGGLQTEIRGALPTKLKLKWKDLKMEVKAHVVDLQEWHVILGVQWPTIGQTVGRWIRECATCQQNKGGHVRSPGLLQQLQIPSKPWRDIAMDFITGLPKSKGNEVIWVIVDRFSRLHDLPESIVSDKDSLFLSEFWQNLFKLSGTRLNMSTTYHPQSDGNTERVNQCLEQYLRNMTSEAPKNWSSWLAAAEWWYNTTFHTALKATPYQIVYGIKPRHLVWQDRTQTNIHSLETLMQEKQQQWNRLKELLEAAQLKMKRYVDAKRTEREFEKGDWVAYKLALPDSSRVHPVFHLSQLKKAIGQLNVQKQLPQVSEQGTFELKPLRQLDNRSILRDHKMVYQKLIQWHGCSVDEATWEDEDLLQCNFHDLWSP